MKITQQPIDHTGPDEAPKENIFITFSCGMNQKMTLLLWIGIFDFGESGLKPDRECDLAESGSTVVGLLVG